MYLKHFQSFDDAVGNYTALLSVTDFEITTVTQFGLIVDLFLIFFESFYCHF